VKRGNSTGHMHAVGDSPANAVSVAPVVQRRRPVRRRRASRHRGGCQFAHYWRGKRARRNLLEFRDPMSAARESFEKLV